MEDLLMGIDNRFKVLMADSTIMCILHTAMNKAHEKVGSKKGAIERLNEQSKFCELAIMQLEVCLKFVQEETSNYTLDTTYDKLLSDLTEIKNRLYGRLKETEIALAEKDQELADKDKALATKEKELQALRRNKEETKEGNFCELKNSVDQQFWSIKHQLEGERMALTRRTVSMVVEDSEVLDVARDCSVDETETDQCDVSPSKMAFDQMGFEMDRLKGTLDAAFGIMQNTISDVCSLEVQWNVSQTTPQFSELDNHLQSHLQEDVELLFFKEMANSWTQEFNNYRFEHSIRLEVLWCAFIETLKDCQKVIQVYEAHANTKINGNKSLIQKINSLLYDIDMEVFSKQISKTREESMHLDLVASDFKETHILDTYDGMSTENEVNFSDASSKLENVLQQLGTTISLLKRLGYNEDEDEDEDINASTNDKSQSLISLQKIDSTLFRDHNHDSFILMYDNFEARIQNVLNLYNSRLRKMSDQMKTLVKQFGIHKRNELLSYKKAFIIRCQNLHKAEMEVDILGDQVDTLTGLLERIYKTLDYYSPVLQHFTGVLDILIWIRNELNLGVATHTPNYGF